MSYFFTNTNQIKNKKVTAYLPAAGAISSQKIDLSGLKDVILPPQPAFFPPAWGWWAVAGSIIACFFLLWFLKRYFYPSPKVYALRLLKKLERENLSPHESARELSKLLKRVALLRFKREDVANLNGTQWENFLRTHAQNCFSPQEAAFIAHAAYTPPEKFVAFNNKNLYNSAEKWIRTLFKRKTKCPLNNKTS